MGAEKKEYKKGDLPELCPRCWTRLSLRDVDNKVEWYCFSCSSNMYQAPKRVL